MPNYQGVLNSYPNWKKLGYAVNRQEKGLDILVPAPKTFTKKNEETEEDEAQTNAWEDFKNKLVAINEKIYANMEIDYNIAKEFIKKNFPELTIIENFKGEDYFKTLHIQDPSKPHHFSSKFYLAIF